MYLGVDIGSLAAKAVLLDEDGTAKAWAVRESGHDHRRVAEELTDRVLSDTGLGPEALKRVVGTGYGRASVPSAGQTITEITCHARGAASLIPGCRMVVDVGGQDSKVILIDGAGQALDFSMNDRCAAGTGRFLEIMAASLDIPLEQVGEKALGADGSARISNVCTVFAESEVVGLISQGEDRSRILKGICRSIAERVTGLARRLGPASPVVMTGGVALNRGVVAALEEQLGLAVTVPSHPQIAGALGAALIAREGWEGP